MSQGACFSLELSESEWTALSQLSATAGMTAQQFVRFRLLHQQSHFDAVTKVERQAAILTELANKIEVVCQIYLYGRKLAVKPEEFRTFLAALSNVLSEETHRLTEKLREC